MDRTPSSYELLHNRYVRPHSHVQVSPTHLMHNNMARHYHAMLLAIIVVALILLQECVEATITFSEFPYSGINYETKVAAFGQTFSPGHEYGAHIQHLSGDPYLCEGSAADELVIPEFRYCC